LDFIRVGIKENKDGTREFFPSLQVLRSEDLVIRGGSFVAIWDEDVQLYSRKIYDVADIIDRAFAHMIAEKVRPGDSIKKMRSFDNTYFTRFLSYVRSIGDMGPDLDQRIIFADQHPTKQDAATFKMDYSMGAGSISAWDELLGVLYSQHERLKIEWAIGSIFSGDAATVIQKMYVFYGPPGSGKSTIMNIIERLFEGHTAIFSAFEMGRRDAQFSLEPFKDNPLVAIDQDGDMSRLEANKNLNSIVSHDPVLINAKGKNLFTIKPRATLFVGSNESVRISDRKSGLFRRLVDIQPTGQRISERKYHQLMKQVEFELGAIAHHCLSTYKVHGPTYFSEYRSVEMMYRTNDIFNFVEDNRLVLSKGIALKQAHKMYMNWCDETDTKAVYKQYRFRDLLRDYFEEFQDQVMIEGQRYRSYFSVLKPLESFQWDPEREELVSWLTLKDELLKPGPLTEALADCPAQYHSAANDRPMHKWENVTTTLKDLKTTALHYVKIPLQHIVIDFDLKNEKGEKDLSLNLAAAAGWPPTYAEVSKSGQGLHLHYNYVGDVHLLAPSVSEGIEIKTLLGDASLRRRYTKSNDLPIATLSGGLPLREERAVLSAQSFMTEKGLRDLLVRTLSRQIHEHTKPSMDFIKKQLDDALAQGLVFDVTDMYDDVFSFAMTSSNQRDVCLEILSQLKFRSEEDVPAEVPPETPVVYFDCEVYRNLFVVCWMYDRDDAELVEMVNPSPAEIEELFKFRLIGFYNRNYDNHILWARSLGYSNEKLYELSQAITSNDRNAMFGAAYNLHYADVYDYASEKKSLKKWEIELGLPHVEIDIPWDQDVPEERIHDVVRYCCNDVIATREVAKARAGDFNARRILAELSGLEICNTTRQHTEKLIFGDVKDTSDELVYTDLSKEFPGYVFDKFKPRKEASTYKGESVGEGGYVYAEPGMYKDVVLLDVASMHPTSIVVLNAFGKYTSVFKQLLDTRLLIKDGNLAEAAKLYGGRLAAYLGDPEEAEQLSYALKIVINTVYGLTAASFPNRFRDSRNIDNIVAKRGALFMVDLKEFVQNKGFTVAHIKTDSIKIPGATPELIQEVTLFGEKYGYTFEHEATYSRFCLVNDAVYVAKYAWAQKEKKIGTWETTGAQFQHPVVRKRLFTGEVEESSDYVEAKQVSKGAMYLVASDESRSFIGRFGAFVPVLHGRALMRVDGDKAHAVTGTKGYLWESADAAFGMGLTVDQSYFEALVVNAIETINNFGSFEEFVA
jgi:energy-coupling factor transporter ATP-binding protein EcfA2